MNNPSRSVLARSVLAQDQFADTDLSGRVVLVADGGDRVGEEITRAVLEWGAEAVVPTSTQERADALQDRIDTSLAGRLTTWPVGISTPEEAEQVLDGIRQQHGRLDAIIDALRHPWEGASLTEVTMQTWRRVLDTNLTAHFVIARTFLPSIADQARASYVTILAMDAEEPRIEMGPTPIAAAGQEMMVRTLIREYESYLVRINAVVAGPVVAPEGDKRRARFGHEPLRAADLGAFVALLTAPAGRMIGGELIRLPDRKALRNWMGQ